MEGRDHQASDARLTIAASNGDDDAFAALYARYAPRISAYLSRLLDDEHLAQDLTHEVFVSALRRLRNDRPPIAFGPWLYRIARNASIDVHRRAQIVRQVPLDQDGEPVGVAARENGPEAAAEVRQWLEQLRDVLGGLSETHRSVLVLRELEGLSNAEIGRRLGVSRPAVEGLLFRARAKMRREYDDLASGRRCETVQASLDRAGEGHRLGARELGVASRHVRACAQCRRHAWELGVAALLAERDGAAPRRALVPIPLALAVLVERLHARLHAVGRGIADPPAALATAGGRTAAAVTALALAGGAAVPSVRHAVVAPDARADALAAPPVQVWLAAVRSPAAAPTRLREPQAAAPGAGTRERLAVAPAPSGSLASPAATPTDLPGERAPSPAGPATSTSAGEAAAEAPADAVAATQAQPAATHRPARPRRPVRDAGDRAVDHATRPSHRPGAPRPGAGDRVRHVADRAPGAAGNQLRRAADRAGTGAAALVQHVVDQAAPSAGRAADGAADPAGGVVTEAAQTAAQVLDQVAGAPQEPAAAAQDARPAQDVAGTAGDVAGAVTGAVPAVPVAPLDPPAPAPPPPPAPPAAPKPPAVPDVPVPKPSDAASAPPLSDPHLAGSGTLGERRRAEAFR